MGKEKLAQRGGDGFACARGQREGDGMGFRVREENGIGEGREGDGRPRGTPLRGKEGERRGAGGWAPAFARGNGRGARERRGLGVEGVLMGGMVARRIEGMGFRVRVCTEGGHPHHSLPPSRGEGDGSPHARGHGLKRKGAGRLARPLWGFRWVSGCQVRGL